MTEDKKKAQKGSAKDKAQAVAPEEKKPPVQNTDSKKTAQKVNSSESKIELSGKSDSKPSQEVPQTKNKKQEDVKEPKPEKKAERVKLSGLFAFKMSMTTFYNDKGESVPVTALKYEPCFVSQIKKEDKESYNAVQVAFKAQKNKRCSKALIKHLYPAGFKEGARFVREVRQTLSEEIKVGREVSIESLKKGDLVKISSVSKGRGFAGVMKRWNFRGGKSSHGSKSHRRIGSIGQHTEPARVMPGRKMPGQYGNRQISKLKVPVVDVFPEEGMIFVKGSVPGARNTLVSLTKMS